MNQPTSYSIRSSAVLTDTYVAGTVVDTGGEYNQAVVYLDFTVGSLTTAEFKFEFSNDNVTYFQETNASVSAGVTTETLASHQVGNASGKFRIPVPMIERYLKVSVKGTGTMTNSLMAVSVVLAKV